MCSALLIPEHKNSLLMAVLVQDDLESTSMQMISPEWLLPLWEDIQSVMGNAKNTYCYSNTHTNILFQKDSIPKGLIQAFMKSFKSPMREQAQSHEVETSNTPYTVWITGHWRLRQVMGNSLWETQSLTKTTQS